MRAARVNIPESVRVRLTLGLMLSLLALLVFALWRMQVAHGGAYEKDLERQSVRRVRLPGYRGRMIDRNGVELAANRPSYCMAIYLEELRQPGPWSNTINRVERLIGDLSKVLGLPPQIDREAIAVHIRKRLPLPLLAWRDIGQEALARWAEQAVGMPGVDVYTEAVRVYPQGTAGAHVLGFVGRAEPPDDPDNPYHYYLPEMAGKSGLEKRYDKTLRGEAGGRLVRVDVSGFRRDDSALDHLTRPPRLGRDLRLTLDAHIQRLAEEALGDKAGALVVLDPDNGDVLAMSSHPGFDPNAFVPAISARQWKALVGNPLKPLLNRAVAGAYAPGSIFKPIVAMAALENHRVPPRVTFHCPGYFLLGNSRWRCAHGVAHGTLTIEQAIEHSCNVFFYKLGMATGYEYIYHMASALGLGRKTGIDLDYERPGLLPDDGWMRRTFGHGWRAGDTVNTSIGQGALTVTPLQMAVVAAALANGGKVWRPRLVSGIGNAETGVFEAVAPRLVNDLHWAPSSLNIVRAGMRDVIMSPHGTGRRAAVPGVVMAGKTGTAEFGPKGKRKYHVWMIVFAPFDHPRYAVSMVLDEGLSGGASVGPRLQHFFERLFAGTGEASG